MGFCRTTKPDHGKLVLWEKSTKTLCKALQDKWNHTDGIHKKNQKSSPFSARVTNSKTAWFCVLDISYHNKKANEIKDVKKHEKEILGRIQFLGDYPENCTSTAFSHIFQGGYSAGYYSYKWAEVLDADAFELFLEKGVFDLKTSKSFKENILSKGGTEHPMILYKKFRGKAPSPKALLKRAGLVL